MQVLSISEFLSETENRPLYIDGGRTHSLLPFLDEVEALRVKLTLHAEKRWILTAESCISFLRGFLALLLSHKEIILPPNNQPKTIDQVIERSEAILCDNSIISRLPQMDIKTVPAAVMMRERKPSVEINSSDCIIEVCTSGSTGTPQQIRKPLQTFEREIICLERLWGNKVAGHLFISTVSHQHIYGLLFRLLWPLLTRRLILNGTINYPEQVEEIVDETIPLVLISSPAYLKRVAGVIRDNEANKRIGVIFSSGGPLTRDVALIYENLLGISPIEVLGSTETGGVGFRQQTANTEEALWRRMPDVEIRKRANDDALEIRSPFCFTPNWYAMGDKVKLYNSVNFALIGRHDRIVKLEEKRISLDYMEKVLEQNECVKQVIIFTIEGRRTILGAVCTLTEAGWKKLNKLGKNLFTSKLKDYLRGYFEQTILPRKWRYVEEIQCNSQGKITQEILLNLLYEVEYDSNAPSDC